MELGDSYGSTEAKIESPEGDGKTIGRPTESTNPDLRELLEMEPTTKEHTLLYMQGLE